MSRIVDALRKKEQEINTLKEKVLKEKKTPPKKKLSVPIHKQPIPLEEKLKNKAYVARSNDDSGINPRIVSYFDPTAHIPEQYRMLRTNIQSAKHPKALKTILISSSLHGEGKTVTAVNLAVTMAQDSDKKILLADCDLRAGMVHELLAIEPEKGLSDVLSNGTVFEKAFYRTKIENLTIMPRGAITDNPAELLGSKKMKKLLDELKSVFDYIILDTPPAIALTDACVLASQVDGVVFVVQAHRTPRRLVTQSQNLLKQVNAKMLGFVLTHTKEYFPKYGYRYYKYGSSYGQSRKEEDSN